MKLTFEQAYKLLEDCSAVVWEDYFLTFPALRDEQDEDPGNDLFLQLESTDEHGRVFGADFFRGNNQEVKAEGSSLFLTDSNGEEVQISLLAPMTLETGVCRKCGSPLKNDRCTDETCPHSDFEQTWEVSKYL